MKYFGQNENALGQELHTVHHFHNQVKTYHSLENYNLFVASSTDNGGLLTLFYLRCGETVKRFRGHKNCRDICIPLSHQVYNVLLLEMKVFAAQLF